MNIREFQLERYLAEHEFSAPYLLCTSDCETFTIADLLSLDKESEQGFKDLRLGYTESQGSPALREEIAGWYESLSPDEIVVTSGAEEAIFIAMQVLLTAGDHVIVETPSYQSLHEIPRSIGCRISPWMLSERSGKWELDIQALQDLIKPDTKVLVLNSPHNPTGHHCNQNEWRAIREICDDHDVAIISDEVYRGIEHESAGLLPAMADVSENGYSLGVMSKALGLAGLRIGWIAASDSAFRRKFLSFKDYTTICNSAPSEYLSTVALRQKEIILKRNLQIIHDNLKVLDDFFACHTDILTWAHPSAGSTAFPRLINDQPVEQFCSQVRKETGVLLLPGTVFGIDTPHFRIGYGRRDMPDVLARLATMLEKQ